MIEDKIKQALRDLVGVMYRDLHGAYGVEAYEGWYEREISQLAKVISNMKEE